MEALLQPAAAAGTEPSGRASSAAWQEFTVYGVPVRSELAFLDAGGRRPEGPPEIEIRLAPAEYFEEALGGAAAQPEPGAWQHTVFLSDGSAYVWWRDMFEFHVSAGGGLIHLRRLRDLPDLALETYLLGQVFSYALVKRGIEVLHATTLEVEGEAISLLGECGAGKSSLAAAFLAAGHRLLSDDLLVLQESSAGLLAQPALPRIKIYPEVADLFAIPRQGAAPMHPSFRKLVLRLDGSAAVRPAPVRAMYELAAPRRPESRRITLRRLSARQAFLCLLRHVFNSKMTAPERLQQLTVFVHRLAERIPIRRVTYRRVFENLPRVRDRILEDFAALRRAGAAMREEAP